MKAFNIYENLCNFKVNFGKQQLMITVLTPTAQNDQTHSKNSSAESCSFVVWRFSGNQVLKG